MKYKNINHLNLKAFLVGHYGSKKIYITLDTDALKQALKFCEELLNEGKEVYLVELPGKDPSEMGFECFTNLIQKSIPLNQFTLMEKKIILI